MSLLEDGQSDADDTWMYFGSFSESEIAGATGLLEKNGVAFEIRKETEQPSYDSKGWTGPFVLWIADSDCLRAQALMVPFFAAQQNQNTH